MYSDGLGEYQALGDGPSRSRSSAPSASSRATISPSARAMPDGPRPRPRRRSRVPSADASRFSRTALAMTRRSPSSSSTADDVLHPLAGRTVRSATALPIATEGARLEGDGLALSTIKTSENGEWLVLRCVNLTEREIAGAWTLGAPVHEARLSRLDESVRELVRIKTIVCPSLPLRARSSRSLSIKSARACLQLVAGEPVAQGVAEQRAREHRER